MERPHVTLSDRGRLALLAAAVVAFLAFLFGAMAGANAGSGDSVGYVRHLVPPTASLAARQERAFALVTSYTDYIARGTPNKKEVALTFDDGPGPFTPQILRVLNETRTPATFFNVGSQYTSFAVAAQATAVGGYPIGNHTESHPAMATLSRADQNSQIEQANQQYAAAGIARPVLFRPPYGSYNDVTSALMRKKKLLMVLWSVDSQDYRQPGADAIVQNVLGGITAGDIVLMHDGGGDRSQTVAALPRIIKGLRERGLKPVTVPQLVLDDPPPRNQPPAPNLGAG